MAHHDIGKEIKEALTSKNPEQGLKQVQEEIKDWMSKHGGAKASLQDLVRERNAINAELKAAGFPDLHIGNFDASGKFTLKDTKHADKTIVVGADHKATVNGSEAVFASKGHLAPKATPEDAAPKATHRTDDGSPGTPAHPSDAHKHTHEVHAHKATPGNEHDETEGPRATPR